MRQRLFDALHNAKNPGKITARDNEKFKLKLLIVDNEKTSPRSSPHPKSSNIYKTVNYNCGAQRKAALFGMKNLKHQHVCRLRKSSIKIERRRRTLFSLHFPPLSNGRPEFDKQSIVFAVHVPIVISTS